MINGGIYAYNFTGSTSAEFQNTHPAIVIQNNKEPELYYVIPLTSYTEDRWKRYKRCFACRILSTNSIALVYKMQIVHYKNIGKRYYNNNEPLIITDEEFDKVCEKLQALINKSVSVAKRNSSQYHTDANTFKSALQKFVETNQLSPNDLFDLSDNGTELTYKIKVHKSYWQDYEYIVNEIFSDYVFSIADNILKIILKNPQKPIDK